MLGHHAAANAPHACNTDSSTTGQKPNCFVYLQHTRPGISCQWALHTSHGCDGAAQAGAASNDDGLNAPGLLALVQALVADGLFDVCVCGPADEQVSSCAEELPPSAVLVHLLLQTARQWSVARGLHRCCGPSELSAVCCSPAPQALTLVAGLQSAKSHAITLGRPLGSYPIEVPQTAEAYAVRAPLYVLELRYAISADASARMRDLAAHKPAYVRHAGRGNARRLSHAGPQQLTVQGAAAGSLSCLARVRFLSGCI